MPSAGPPAPARPPAPPLFPRRPPAPARPVSPRPLLADEDRDALLPVSLLLLLLLLRSIEVDVGLAVPLLDVMGIAGCSRNPPPRPPMPPPLLPPRWGFVFVDAVAGGATAVCLVLADISMSLSSLSSPSHPHPSASASPESALFAVSTLECPVVSTRHQTGRAGRINVRPGKGGCRETESMMKMCLAGREGSQQGCGTDMGCAPSG